jgi:hypothetical protein
MDRELKLMADDGQNGKAATSRSIPKGEQRTGNGRTQAGRPRHYRKESCHSTKRTHRFLMDFSV